MINCDIFLPQKAEKSLKFYKGCGDSASETTAISVEIERIKASAIERQANKKLHLKDICKCGRECRR